MQVLYPCCCGLDIHKKFVVACVLTTNAEGHVQKESRTFSTMTQDLTGAARLAAARSAVPMSPWKVPVRTGGRSTICWKGNSRCSWAMPTT